MSGRDSSPAMRLRPRKGAAAACTTAVLILAALGTARLGGLRVNGTASMPRGLWRVVPAAAVLRRGEVVSICLPDGPPRREAAARGYVAAGSCPGGLEPLVKPVAAVPGDVVTVGPGGVAVNGLAMENTAQLARDSAGRRLQLVPAGTYRVEPGQVWLLSGHDARSFDSRYFGPVPAAGVLGTAKPVWVFP